MVARRLVVATLVFACAMVVDAQAEASEAGRYRRVTVDEVQCRDCGAPVPIGISLLVPASWKIHEVDGALTATDAQNPQQGLTVGPAFVWRSGLPSPHDVRAHLRDVAGQSGVENENVIVKRTTIAPGVRGIVQSVVLGKMRSVTYLFEGQSFPVLAIGFYRPSESNQEFDAAATKMIRSIKRGA